MPRPIRLRPLLALALSGLSLAAAILLAPASGAAVGPAPAPGPAPTSAPPATPGLVYETGTATSSPAVWIASPTGAGPRRLGQGVQPLLSPDGTLVAASLQGPSSGPDNGSALGIYQTAGSPPKKYLSLGEYSVQPLAWSADSRYLALDLLSTGSNKKLPQDSLAVLDTSTGTLEVLVTGQIYGASFAPSSSDELVYGYAPSMAVSAPVNIYVCNPEGGGRRRLTSDNRSLDPLWGPSSIAFDHERMRREAPEYQIWQMSPTGQGAHKLTSMKVPALVEGLVPRAWSGDGKRMIAEYIGEDTTGTWTVSPVTGRVHQITVGGQLVTFGGLSQDGTKVLVAAGAFEAPPSSGRILAVPLAGGKPTVLIRHGAWPSWNV